jgi:protein tyrosine phosphatase (PTP) superfamily phosphohydrolase (DUF442 family)
MPSANTARQDSETAPTRCGRFARWTARGLAVLAVTLGAWWLIEVLFGENLHTVIPGRVYRGAQPTEATIERLVRDYGIRTIVNLRGIGNPLPWYLAEGRAAQHCGIGLEDVTFSAIHLPPPSELRELIEVLDRAEYPIFLHCRHGADRTGLGSAVVLLLEDGVPYAQARRELGLYYGHIALGRTGLLDRFFDLYEEWLQQTGQEHSPERFRHWALEEYRGGWCEGSVEHVEPMGSARAGEPIAYRVHLHNRSHSVWQFKPTVTAGVHVCFRVCDSGGVNLVEGRAGLLDRAVQPSERFAVTMVVPPLPAGRYWLNVDLIEEYHCWFYQVGAELWEEEIVVRE